MPEISRHLSFDAGIERILSRSDPIAPSLPESNQVLPGETHYEEHLTDLLLPPSVEQALAESFRPDVEHREILTPVGYETALDETETTMRTSIDRSISRSDQEKLESAVQLLEEEKNLRELLRTYRHLLHQG